MSHHPEDAAADDSTQIKDAWSIRPCSAYIDEFDDCTSIKARFHQYFVHGENTDCNQWKVDYDNCLLYETSNGNNTVAGKAIVESESQRRRERMKAHYENTTWQKRNNPPEDWAKPLPAWLEERNQNTYLQLKKMEMEGQSVPEAKAEASYCTIM